MEMKQLFKRFQLAIKCTQLTIRYEISVKRLFFLKCGFIIPDYLNPKQNIEKQETKFFLDRLGFKKKVN